MFDVLGIVLVLACQNDVDFFAVNMDRSRELGLVLARLAPMLPPQKLPAL